MTEVLSFMEYSDKDKRYGDCFLLWDNQYFIVYDCGSVEHAENVLKYMRNNNIGKIDYLVLSHDDSDYSMTYPKIAKNIDILSF